MFIVAMILTFLLSGCATEDSYLIKQNELPPKEGSENNGISDETLMNGNSLFGEWVISKFLTYTQVSAGEFDSNLIGVKLSFKRDSVMYGDSILNSPKYKVSEVTEDTFYQGYYTSLKEVGINENKTLEVDVFDNQNPSKEWDIPFKGFYIQDNDTIVAYHKQGMFYQMKRLNK